MIDSVLTWATRVQGRRLPVRPDGAPAEVVDGQAAAGAGPADAAAGTGSTDARSTCTARAGTSARWPTTPASCRRRSSRWPAPGSAPSTTGCATRVRGGGPFDENPHIQGFASGQYTDPNGDPINGTAAEQRERLLLNQDRIKVGLTGNLRDYRFVDRTGATVTGADVDYNGAADRLHPRPAGGGHLRRGARQRDAVRRADLQAARGDQPWPTGSGCRRSALSTTALGQGVSFWHAGGDILRSKSLDRNSYDSGDWFNVLDFTYPENGFGRGLPPAPDNEAKWPYMRPLLANPALDPGAGRHPRRRGGRPTRCWRSGRAPAVPPRHRRPGPAEGVVPRRRAGPDAWGDRDADRRHRRRRRRPAAEGPGGGVQRRAARRPPRRWPGRRGSGSRCIRSRPTAPTRWSRARRTTGRPGRSPCRAGRSRCSSSASWL